MGEYHTVEIKKPGEKLIRVAVAGENGIVMRVLITGDFFIYPEEDLEIIESVLAGSRADSRVLTSLLSELVRSRGIEMMGVSVATIAEAIIVALEKTDG